MAMTRRSALLAGLAPLSFAQDRDVLASLTKGHPRLIASDTDLTRVRKLIESNQNARGIYQSLNKRADRIAQQPPVEYKLIGPRLLDKSRTALDRIYTLAFLYRLDRKPEHLQRALVELRAVCNFPDWHPPHFLDTAEMTHAVAIGYDWLHADLSAEDKALFRTALTKHGLDAGLEQYRSKAGWWTKSPFNWNQVCNGGLTMGALALADEEPDRAREIVSNAVKSLPAAMASYAPDGDWAEGPGYWDYATSYTVYMLAALQSALGTDFGLGDMPGFDQAGRFRIYFTGPTGLSFNYADAASRVGPSAAMFWLARRFHNPVYAWQEQQLTAKGRGSALDLIWFEEKAISPAESKWPLVASFRGVDVGFVRNSWESPDAVFVAVKGGDNHANHGHLDLGSFVLDAGGQRWAIDLGGDNYNLPDYFGKKRWTYYRMRSESHNTLLADAENQNVAAKASAKATSDSIVIDLAQAYPDKLSAWTREIAFRDGAVIVRDRIQAKSTVDLLWGMVTEADVAVDGASAELRLGGKRLTASITSPRNAAFEIVSTRPAEPQNPSAGTRKLAIRLPGKAQAVEIAVKMSLTDGPG